MKSIGYFVFTKHYIQYQVFKSSYTNARLNGGSQGRRGGCDNGWPSVGEHSGRPLAVPDRRDGQGPGMSHYPYLPGDRPRLGTADRLCLLIVR